MIVSNLASNKRVFKSQVLYEIRVFKIRDANLQLSFKHVLTYYFLSCCYAGPKISPKLFLHKLEPDSIPTLPNIACLSLALSHTI